LEGVPEPREICAIAQGEAEGDRNAALEAFRRLGEVVGDALAGAVTLVDALVVVGGGLAGAAPLFLPALVEEMNAPLGPEAGSQRLEVTAFNLEEAEGRARFLRGEKRRIAIPGSDRKVDYDPMKRTGVGISRLGTSRAVALGAYAYALAKLD
jgi:glucokinase